ncbi:hypothetical protein A3A66_01395 [Microgenomates group bacterium RIFCSPLOWO2_01_FULL_46_13]|nr:MAG: hypothetical protein A2783_02545 [Microgenomates group bacterium RIFCSPHIGHO2_01_FULL_45_11]OGV94653.1 MAG: hypothetical protein A3A66_01395 [Microgenomates group bacterium RIFCSPLOWO2_01_FULL_46_13]
MAISWLVIGLIALVLVYVLGIYNSLQTIKTRIKASIQEIGNQLKRQASLIPNLEESAKGYLKHEKEIYKSLTDARKAVQAAAKSATASTVNKAVESLETLLPKLTVLVESNPQLKANEVITKLMDELRDTADKLMYARRTLIDLAADFNVKLVTFPSSMVAKLFSFQQEKGLETPTSGEHLAVSAEEMKEPKVDL